MILSIHLAEVGRRDALATLRRPPRPADVSGLIYAETAFTAPIDGRLLPAPDLGRVALIAGWEDDAALDSFADRHPLAERFANGWQVRMQPLRVSGGWPQMPGLPERPLPVDDEEPVAVLTLGRPRVSRLIPFLRSAAAAEAGSVGDPALLLATGLGRPPKLVSTFTVWRSAAAMKEYSYRQAGAHQAAVRADRSRPFHHESAFIRLRPYASSGNWDGRDPLAEAAMAGRGAVS